jgi:hypothetical protein
MTPWCCPQAIENKGQLKECERKELLAQFLQEYENKRVGNFGDAERGEMYFAITRGMAARRVRY